MSLSTLTVLEARRIVREDDLRDKSYQLTPIGEIVADYLRHKRKRLTKTSQRDYEGTLDKLARDFADLEVKDFEPPIGTRRLEEFLDARWGHSAPGTYNVCLAHCTDFFRYCCRQGRLQGDPSLNVERARKRDPIRHTFSDDDRLAIIGNASELRDRIALRLLFDYGLRKGALQAIQFKHFDAGRRRLTIFTKGQKVRSLPLPDPQLWLELEQHILATEAQPIHFLMCVVKPIPRAGTRRFPEKRMSSTALQRWWVKRWEDVGIPYSPTREMNMHAARHTAGQRMLDHTGNLKAVQQLLGHASIATTGDTYTSWADDQLARSLMETLAEGDR